MQIRPLVDGDEAAVMSLNEESVEYLSPMTADSLQRLRVVTEHALVCEVDGQVAGFAVAYEPGADYPSINYRWHEQRFDDFLYLDRIAVNASFRRRGVASALYDAMEGTAAPHGRMVCEVYSEPPNHQSLAFHERRGYREVGHLMQANGHECVMLVKEL